MKSQSRRAATVDLESGSISLFAAVSALALIAMIGLVVDGGGKVQALSRAETAAREGARAAAQALQQDAQGQVSVDPLRARREARQYFDQVGVTGTVQVRGGTQVTADTVVTYKPIVLAMIGMGEQQATGHAVARAGLVGNGVDQ